MKKINMNYTTNDQLWSIEDLAANHGYTKANDCYWAQIFENENGDQIITSREDTASADPVADLAALLDEAEAPAETAEQCTESRAMKVNTMKYMIIYCKTNPAISYRTEDAARRAAAEMSLTVSTVGDLWKILHATH